jgi:beta-lactamase regulating signal transducer with metallopeptidase domain
MREHVAPFVYYLEVHLLYASLLCLAAWALTSIGSASATWKYWIWVATSLNFIVPLGGFFDRFGASTFSWATQLRGLDAIGVDLSHHLTAGGVLAGVWVCGTTAMLVRLLLRVQADHREAFEACDSPRVLRRSFPTLGVPVRFSGTSRAPSVQGFMRPNIALPEGIERLLGKAELNAVLMHEVTHAKRRDNLIGLIHELALCALWFHPLVWLTAFRLALYRELSCDDSVIAKAQGTYLLTALAKLADPEEPSLLQARASSFMSLRVARLVSSQPGAPCNVTNAIVAALFGALLLACILGTIAHTAHCFVIRT